MALRIRFQYPTGANLGFSIERLSDGLLFDFASGQFMSNPTNPIQSLPEDSGIFGGRYKMTLAPTPPSQFVNGDYVITVHDRNATNLVVGELATVMSSGDDATVIPSGGGASLDPWSVTLPGNYPSGSAGFILGKNLDTAISTRSTFQGGPVSSVVNPVTVSQNLDKVGYSLSSAGLDAIQIESGINARQALSPILAASAGTLAGAGSGSITIAAAGGSATRITATTDNAGNRTNVSLTLPV